MSLSVNLQLGDKPTIKVEGQTIQPLRRDQLSDLLHGEDDLRRRVERLHGGRHVDGVHLSDDDQLPSKLRGTFAKYRWQPATLTNRAQSARILKVTSNPVIVGRAPARNHSDVKGTASYEISDTVSDSIERESHWDVSSTVTQTVEYKVGGDAVGGSVGGSTSLSFTGGYGESTGNTHSVELGSKGSGSVELEPGEEVIVELTATRGQIEAQVDYLQTLTGGVFYHYGKRVDGHYLWYAPLSKLYSQQELRQVHTEVLKVHMYSNMEIVFNNP